MCMLSQFYIESDYVVSFIATGRSTGLEAVTAGFTRGRTGFTFTYSLAENDKSVFSGTLAHILYSM